MHRRSSAHYARASPPSPASTGPGSSASTATQRCYAPARRPGDARLDAQAHALAGDEHLVLLQAKAFAAGRLSAQFPPELLSWVVPRPYVNLWLYASPQTGAVVSVYWPGFALLLAPFALLGIPWACI